MDYRTECERLGTQCARAQARHDSGMVNHCNRQLSHILAIVQDGDRQELRNYYTRAYRAESGIDDDSNNLARNLNTR